MKKILAFVLVACSVVLVGCAGKAEPKTIEINDPPANKDKIEGSTLAADTEFVLVFLSDNYSEYQEAFEVYLNYGVAKIVNGLSDSNKDVLAGYVLEIRSAIDNGYDFSFKMGFATGVNEIVDDMDALLFAEWYGQMHQN